MEVIEAVLARAADAAKRVVRDRHLCVLMTLNAKNVFNLAPWEQIDAVVAGIGLLLYVRRILQSYLTDRAILVPHDGGFESRVMTCGVPQRSVLGPTLWNIFYDGLLRLRLPEGASLTGFANDVGLVVVNHTSEGIERVANELPDGLPTMV